MKTQGIPPILVRCHSDETEIVVDGRRTVRIRRTSHQVLRLVGRLTAETGRPVHWMEIAERIWTAADQLDRLSTLWTQQRSRLQAQLQDNDLPTWLLRTDGGLVQLGLRLEDSFHDAGPLAP